MVSSTTSDCWVPMTMSSKSRGVASAWAMPNGRRSGPGRIPIPTRPDGSSASIVSTRSLLLRTRSWSA